MKSEIQCAWVAAGTEFFMFRWLHDHGAHVVLEQSMVCGFAGAFFQCSLGGSVKEVLGTHIQAPIAWGRQ